MASSFTIANAAAANKTYTPGISSPSAQEYVSGDSTAQVPVKATSKHTFGIPKGKVDKHLVQFTISRPDATSGEYGTVTMNVTVVIPPKGVTSTDIDDIVAFGKNFLSNSTYVAQLKSGVI